MSPAHRRLPLLQTALSSGATPAEIGSRRDPRPRDHNCIPIVAVWELTLKCDLHCAHCGSRAGHPRERELSTESCLSIADELAAIGVREVSLIGGEAYLHPGWLDVIARLSQHNIQVSMVSGGRGLTARKVEDAKAAGLRGVSISIDGMAATHNLLRGTSDAFERASAAINHVREAGLTLSINTQINRRNWKQLEELTENISHWGARSWQFSLTVAMGRAVDNWKLLLQPYELLELYPLLARVVEQAKAMGLQVYPGNNIGYFGPYESLFRGDMPRGHTHGCAAGRRALGIEADGTLKGCPSLDTETYSAGTLQTHRLQDLWTHSRVMQNTRDGAELWGFCSTCYYAAECRGGCTWTSSVLFGKPGNNPYCHHRALELAERGQAEVLVRTAPAPGKPFDTGRFELELRDLPLQSVPTSGARLAQSETAPPLSIS